MCQWEEQVQTASNCIYHPEISPQPIFPASYIKEEPMLTNVGMLYQIQQLYLNHGFLNLSSVDGQYLLSTFCLYKISCNKQLS